LARSPRGLIKTHFVAKRREKERSLSPLIMGYLARPIDMVFVFERNVNIPVTTKTARYASARCL